MASEDPASPKLVGALQRLGCNETCHQNFLEVESRGRLEEEIEAAYAAAVVDHTGALGLLMDVGGDRIFRSTGVHKLLHEHKPLRN